MKTTTINENKLTHNNIEQTNRKSRAILVKDNKILICNYGGIILLPGGSIEEHETPIQALIRELQEETGITYFHEDLQELFLLNYYQFNYPTRDNKIINRLISTYFYFGNFKGINESCIKMTENEKKANFYLELIEIKDLIKKLETNTTNPRKPFFDRELAEAIKVYQKVLTK